MPSKIRSVMNTHNEVIECPECKTVQWAEVEHTEPFYSYVHECDNCKLVIMESEWKKITDEREIKGY